MPGKQGDGLGQGLQIRGLHVRYAGASPVPALQDVNLDIARGELVVALGASGCGKTTLLNCIAGFTEASSGSITLNGRAVTGPGAERGVVFQKHALMPWLNVVDNVALGLRLRGVGRTERRRVALEKLALVGLTAFANAPVAAVHALAYPVGARFHVAHGLSNSLVLPEVLRFNAPVAKPLYAELAGIIVPQARGTADDRTAALISYFATLAADLGLPVRLRDVGIKQEHVGQLAEDAMKQTRLLVNNPRPLTLKDARAIYEAAW